MLTQRITIRALKPLDEAFNWLTNQFLRNPNSNSIEYKIIKSYFQFSTFIGILICLIKLLNKRYNLFKKVTKKNQYLYHQLNHTNQSESFVDVYLHHSSQSKLSIDQLLKFLKYCVDDHRTVLGLWDRNPILEYHFYYDDERNEKDLIKTKLGSLDSLSEKKSSRDRYAAMKPLLNDLLEVVTQTTSHRIMILSTEDQDIIQYGIRLLQLLPNPPLICYVKPIGSTLSLELAIAADIVFEWGEGGRFELVTRDRGSIDEIKDEDRFWNDNKEIEDLKIFRPLVLLFKAHGPIQFTQIKMLDLKALFDKDDSEDRFEFLNQLTFREYLQLAFSKGLIGIQNSNFRLDLISPLDDDEVFNNESTLVHLQSSIEKMFYKEFSSDPFLTQQLQDDNLFRSNQNLEKDDIQFELNQKTASGIDDGMTIMTSDSELVTTSHRSSYTNLGITEPIIESSTSLRARPQLKHAPSDLESMIQTSIRPIKKKKKEKSLIENHILHSTIKLSNEHRGLPKTSKTRSKSTTNQIMNSIPIRKRNFTVDSNHNFINKRCEKRGTNQIKRRLPSFDLEKGMSSSSLRSSSSNQSTLSNLNTSGLWIKSCSQASGLIQREFNGFKSIYDLLISNQKKNLNQIHQIKKDQVFKFDPNVLGSSIHLNSYGNLDQFHSIKMRTEQEELALEID